MSNADQADAYRERAEIEKYVLEHPGADAYDIAVALGLPFRSVMDALENLVETGVLEANP